MKTPVWVMCILLGLASYVACILAQGFPLWSTGQPFLWFPQDTGSIVELFAFMTGVVAVYLVTKEHLWNWPIGIVNVALYGYFFFFVATHYANAWLQVVWLFYLVEGWYRWLNGGENQTALKLSRIEKRHVVIAAGSIVLFTAVLTPILTAANGQLAFLDALTAGISLAAQFLLNRKVLESWILWIIVDIIYIPMYAIRGYHATMLLYAIFLILAIKGFFDWRKALARQEAETFATA